MKSHALTVLDPDGILNAADCCQYCNSPYFRKNFLTVRRSIQR